MEEADQPRVPVEPSEEELRVMLEERERKQAGDWGQLKRWSTRILLALIAVVGVVFFGSGMHKDLATVMFPEPPPAAVSNVPKAPVPMVSAPGTMESTMLEQGSGVDPTPVQPGNGKIIDQADIRFAGQLMHFMDGASKPRARPATPAQEKPKDEK